MKTQHENDELISSPGVKNASGNAEEQGNDENVQETTQQTEENNDIDDWYNEGAF
ncbi:MAG: hypothetical protein JWO09_2664 [Bacteroidetes bacterium]|nr:hypothetical protein [Bacteroidota bacterium]